MFWFWEESSVDNTPPMLIVQLSMLHRAKPFSAKDPRSWEGTELGQLTSTGQRGAL